MRCAKAILSIVPLMMFCLWHAPEAAVAQEVVGPPAPGASAEAEQQSYDLRYVPLDSYKLEKWGSRQYTMYGFPRRLRQDKDVIIGERQRVRIGRITLETVVEEERVLLNDVWTDPAQEYGWAMLNIVCKRDNLLSMQTMRVQQGQNVNLCDVTDGRYEVELAFRRRTGEWPEGTVAEASLLRVFTMLPRVPGITYAINHYTASPELSPYPTTGDAIICHGQETLKINRMNMECTKYTFRDMQAWVRNSDDSLVRFLVPGYREIVIEEKPHEYVQVLEEAATK